MTVKDCIINDIPIWRMKFEGWIVKWTKDNESDKIKDEVWYMVDDKIYKTNIKDFRTGVGGFVWFKNVVDDLTYKDSMIERIDERETVECLFKFFRFIK